MKEYGLLGYPLSHSFSKEYFTNKFRKANIDAVFDIFPIPTILDFPKLLASKPRICGMNVTIPYKKQVMAYLDGLDPEAAAVGAINVIRFDYSNGLKPKLIGYNTDLYGFRESIRPLIAELKTRLGPLDVPLKALVLGTGGASRAVLYGLKQLDVEVTVVSRTEAPNQLTYQQLTPAHYQAHRIVVNTTPLGMNPNADSFPALDYAQFGRAHLLFDLVYNPDKTRFLQFGENQGSIVKNGLEMLHLQAEEAWNIWNPPPK